MTPRGRIPFCPHVPTERQAQFLACPAREALYGGSAGGGKSDALLMCALQYVHIPGYRALILRRSFPQLRLPGGLLERADTWFRPTKARWSERDKTWRFPSGATITFGCYETEADWQRYQGPEFQTVCFDELTQFSESMYRYLFSRTRRLTGSEVPIRMRAASNPGGPGHEWVRDRFEPHLPREKRTVNPQRRAFIPAKLADNPYLDAADYIESLSELDPVTLAQLLDGNWTVRSSLGFFRREWFRVQNEPLPAGLRWVRFWDSAAKAKQRSDYWAGAKVASFRGVVYIGHVIRKKCEYPDAKALVLQTAQVDGRGVKIGIEDSSSGTALVQDLRRDPEASGLTLFLVPVAADKVARAGPWASRAAGGLVRVLPGAWVSDFLDECDGFPEKGLKDDQVDAVSGAYEMLARYGAMVAGGDELRPGGREEEPAPAARGTLFRVPKGGL